MRVAYYWPYICRVCLVTIVTENVFTAKICYFYLKCLLASDAVNDAVKSSLQLLGNTVVKNDATQQFVWNMCFPNFFL